MIRPAVTLALAAALAALALATPGEARKRPVPAPGLGTANPSALVATEIALSRYAAKKGEARAMRAFADDDAVPAGLLAGKREPSHVWMSCDGTIGVTQGSLQGTDGSATGSFLTVWRQRRNGTYRWVLDQSAGRGATDAEPDMITAKVAACTARAARPPEGALVVTAPFANGGRSDDGSLTWSVRTASPCGRVVSIRLRQDGARGTAAEVGAPDFTEVLSATFAPASCGT